MNGQPTRVSGANLFEGHAQVGAGTTGFTITASDLTGNTTTQQYEVDTAGAAKVFTFDANGNLTSDGTRTFEWDARNQLVAVNVGALRTEFTYDGLQRRARIVEKDNGITQSNTKVLWCDKEICEERAGDGIIVMRRAFQFGEQVAGAARFLGVDHLGSVEHVTDAGNTLLARYLFDPWGRRALTAGGDVTTAGYTGHSWHPSGDISLTLYRAYEPALGRWLSDDPAGLVDGINRYSYVGNQPTIRIDSLGLQGAPPGGIYTGTKKGIEAAWLSCLNRGDRRVYSKSTPFNPVVRQEEWRKWKDDFGDGCRMNPSRGYVRYSTCAVSSSYGGSTGFCVCCEGCAPK